MSNRREAIGVTALVLLLSVVGVVGTSWTDEASAQERLVLSRPPVVVEAGTAIALPGGDNVLVAVGTLQLLGILAFEVAAYVRRRTARRAVTPPLAWPVPTPYTSPAHGSTSRTRQAA
jgi:hypothetical protein